MKKTRYVVLAAIAIALYAAAAVLKSFTGSALYEPGMVRNGTNLRGALNPPKQRDGGHHWQVEDDIRLYYDKRGKGSPVLIIHGGPGFPYHHHWEGLEELTDNYTFYYYHQRGCGNSTKPFERFDGNNYYANMTDLEQTLGIGAQVADIERIRRILGQEKLAIIGHSFGGFLASMYAAEFPEHIAALVLVAPAGVLLMPDRDDIFARVGERLSPAERQEFEAFHEEYMDFGNLFTKTETQLMTIHQRNGAYLLKALGEPPSAHAESPRNGGWMPFALYFSMGRKHDYRKSLAQVRTPVLIIHGKDDDLLVNGSRSYRECFPNATFRLISGKSASDRAGHFVFDDQPQQFASAIDDYFLAAVSQ